MAAPLKKEPNKYAKNADIKADTQLKTMLSVIGMILMLVGLAGIGLEFFKGDGILTTVWSWLWDDTSHLIAIPVAVLVLWLVNRMMSSTNPNESKKSGNIPMYVMMAIGAFYVYQFITTGGL